MTRRFSHTVHAIRQALTLLAALLPTAALAQAGGEIHFHGTIGSTHEIEMTLSIDGSDVSGDYQYVSVGRSLTVTGTIDSRGRINLEEDDAAGRPTGRFRGWLVGRSHLFGTWTRVNGTHAVPFDLTTGRHTGVAATAAGTPAAGRATLTKRTLVINRTATVVKDSPGKARATLHYPVVSGLKDPAVLARLKKTLGIASVLRESVDQSTSDIAEDTWVDTVDYTVNCNRNNVLDVTFTVSGSGAYPDHQIIHRRLSLLTGMPIRTHDAFIATEIAALESRLNRMLRAEIADAKRGKDSSAVADALDLARFDRDNLDRFEVGVRGITFVYDYGLPHAQQALAPPGRFFLSYNALKRFIRSDGPLAPFIATAPETPSDEENNSTTSERN
jgi:hypothetical protein